MPVDGYLARIVERDFDDLGHRIRNPAALRRWMTAYAAATSTTASYDTIRDAATGGEGDKPAKTTVQPYRDTLERLWIIDSVPAWQPVGNSITRLTAPPKHHLADPALAARLLGADVDALLAARPLGPPMRRDGVLLGHLFESLVTLSVRVFALAAEASVRHLRTRGDQREIDLIVERGDHRVVAIDVKLAQRVEIFAKTCGLAPAADLRLDGAAVRLPSRPARSGRSPLFAGRTVMGPLARA